jgi:hypothetical protein
VRTEEEIRSNLERVQSFNNSKDAEDFEEGVEVALMWVLKEFEELIP